MRKGFFLLPRGCRPRGSPCSELFLLLLLLLFLANFSFSDCILGSDDRDGSILEISGAPSPPRITPHTADSYGQEFSVASLNLGCRAGNSYSSRICRGVSSSPCSSLSTGTDCTNDVGCRWSGNSCSPLENLWDANRPACSTNDYIRTGLYQGAQRNQINYDRLRDYCQDIGGSCQYLAYIRNGDPNNFLYQFKWIATGEGGEFETPWSENPSFTCSDYESCVDAAPTGLYVYVRACNAFQCTEGVQGDMVTYWFGAENPELSITPNPGSVDGVYTGHITLPASEQTDPQSIHYTLGVLGGQTIQGDISPVEEEREYTVQFDCSPNGQIRCQVGQTILLQVNAYYPDGETYSEASASVRIPGVQVSILPAPSGSFDDTFIGTITLPEHERNPTILTYSIGIEGGGRPTAAGFKILGRTASTRLNLTALPKAACQARG